MFIFKDTKKRGPAYPSITPYTDQVGTRYPGIPQELLEEIPEPLMPEDYTQDTYWRTEQDEAPYVIYTRKSEEMIAQFRQQQSNAVANALLQGTDWVIIRHQDQLLLGVTPTLDAVELKDLLGKRQVARKSIIKTESSILVVKK